LFGKTIRDWEKEFKFELDSLGHFPAEINETEMEKVLKTVREDEIYSKIEILDIDNSKSGYKDGSEPIVNVTLRYEDMIYIAFKGTAGGVEWRDNAYASYPEYAYTEAQKGALDYFDKMYEKYVNCNIKKVYVTGHSKGGNKAQFIMVMRGSTEHTKLKKCFSFCGQGFNKTFITTYSKEIEENKDKEITKNRRQKNIRKNSGKKMKNRRMKENSNIESLEKEIQKNWEILGRDSNGNKKLEKEQL